MSHFRPQVIDGLWHSLCPSFEQYASRSSLHRSRAVSFTGLSCPTHSRYVRARVSRSLVTIIPSHPQSPTFWKQKHVDKPAEATEAAPSTPWSRRAEIQVQEQTHATSSIPTQKPLLDSSSNDIRKLSDAQIHTILRREANCAYYDRVQEIIEILIRERGEKPDRTHYHALISAQANLEHGSAAEVERLLQEMEETKTALDAGTCSAVLKACIPTNRSTGV